MQIRKYVTIIFMLMAAVVVANAQTFSIEDTKVFQPNIPDQNKKILLLKDTKNQQRKLILFKAPLAVNTDGSPTSYHPQDPKGEVKAINTVCNAIVVKKIGGNDNLCRKKSTSQEAIDVFTKWRDSSYLKVPSGYTLTWDSVLTKTKNSDGKEIPCVFKKGVYAGYFSSDTSFKNDLPASQQGECQAKNQLDSLEIPHLVLAKGATNPVSFWGAKVGDLLVAFNPDNNQTVFAIIGDMGPADNLGEGSVALNMKLSNKPLPPKTRQQTYTYTVKNVLIAIIPASSSFNTQKPITAENITDRIKKWQTQAGFKTPADFIKMMKSFQSQFQGSEYQTKKLNLKTKKIKRKNK